MSVRDERSDDGYYLHYMQAVREHGLGAIRLLVTKPDDWPVEPAMRMGAVRLRLEFDLVVSTIVQ